MKRAAAVRMAACIGPVPRLLLLVCLAFGVASMHTFGHSGDVQHRAAAGHAAMDVPAPRHTVVATMVERLGDGHTVTAIGPVAEVGDATGGGMYIHPFTVCLAVLGALGLVVWVVAALIAGHARRADDSARAAVQEAGRGPPAPRLGLRVAARSVLRI